MKRETLCLFSPLIVQDGSEWACVVTVDYSRQATVDRFRTSAVENIRQQSGEIQRPWGWNEKFNVLDISRNFWGGTRDRLILSLWSVVSCVCVGREGYCAAYVAVIIEVVHSLHNSKIDTEWS